VKKFSTLILLLSLVFFTGAYNLFATTPNIEEKTISTPFLKDPALYFEFMRVISKTPEHGADIGESIYTAKQVTIVNPAAPSSDITTTLTSWHDQWKQLAERIEKIGDDCLSKNNKISARDAYLRATEYYRTAEFFLHNPENTNESEINYLSKKWLTCFNKAIKLYNFEIERVKIPYQGTTLPGYYIRANQKSNPGPTLIVQNGFDGTAEELVVQYGFDAARRGYNFLAFEGPGQGQVIREQKLYFRPDWETVVTPVINYILTKKEVDSKRIALYGLSMGGYFAPRAAAYDHRIAACIANSGIYDVFVTNTAGSNLSKEQIVDLLLNQPKMINSLALAGMKNNIQQYWGYNHGMWAFGVKTPSELLLKELDYNLINCVDKIICPVLVIDIEKDQSFGSEAQKLYDQLNCPKTLIVFKKNEGADLNYQIGAQLLSNQRIFDWLEVTLPKKTLPKIKKKNRRK
jgi:esterase/lipase